MASSTPKGQRCPLQRTVARSWRPFKVSPAYPLGSKVQRLLIGTLLARGRRTITAALRHTGQQGTPSFSLYHQVFNRARWSTLKGSRCLLSLLVQTFDAAGGNLAFVIDETLERRRGLRLDKRGHYRPLGFQSQADREHQRAALDRSDLGCHAALEQRPWALPFLSVPAPTPQVSERLGLRHRTISQVGASDDPDGTALVAVRRFHRARRSSLQCRGTRACLSAVRGAPDRASAP